MSVIRAQVIHEHSSGLAKDNAVNTFHFNAIADEEHLQAIADALQAFYHDQVSAGGGAFRSVDSFLASTIVARRFKLYDVTDEPSGPPLLDQRTTTLDARNSTANLPSEVACCMSFQGAPTSGLIQERRRGRVYIGPLNVSASGNPANAVARPAGILMETLRNAGAELAAGVDIDAEWVVYSRPYAGRAAIVRPGRTTLPAIAARPGTTVDINQLWVDDAFDTQRRRGEKATGRGPIVTTE